MKNIKYQDFLQERSFLNRPVKNSQKVGGFTMFKDLEEAKKHLLNENLFIVSLTLTPWSHTDYYPELHDGVIDKAFGYFIAYGKNKGESCLFEDFKL